MLKIVYSNQEVLKMNVALFFDFNTISKDLQKYGLPSFKFDELVDYLADSKEGRFFKSGFSYIDKGLEEKTSLDDVINQFKLANFVTRVKSKASENPSGFEVEMSIDALEIIYHNNIDIISIYSNSTKLIPLIIHLQNKGYRVEIIGFSKNELTDYSLGFIDLSEAVKSDLMYYQNVEKEKILGE